MKGRSVIGLPDEACPNCGLRSCLVKILTERYARTSAGTIDRKAEQEITAAQDTCDAFSRARKKPS